MPLSASCTASRLRRAAECRLLSRNATSSSSRDRAACGRMAIPTTQISISAAPTRFRASPIVPSMQRSPICGPKSQKRKRPRPPDRRQQIATRTAASAASLETGHRAVDALEGKRKHAVFGDPPDHSDAGGAGPGFLWHRVEPHRPRIGLEEPAQPYLARLVVPPLDAAAFLLDLVGAHAGVADQDDPEASIVSANKLDDRHLLDMASSRIAPHRIVDAVVEVEVDQVLELRARGREQFLANTNVVLHRPADIEKQQQLYGVVPLGHELEIEPARVVRGRFYGAAEIELFGGTLARKLPQAA